MANDHEVGTDEPGGSRRGFIKRMAMVGAFTAPVVSSFAMDGLMAPAGAQASNQSGFGSNQP
jgi:hypothetical protein